MEALQSPWAVLPDLTTASQPWPDWRRWLRGSPTDSTGSETKRDDSFTARSEFKQADAWKPQRVHERCGQK